MLFYNKPVKLTIIRGSLGWFSYIHSHWNIVNCSSAQRDHELFPIFFFLISLNHTLELAWNAISANHWFIEEWVRHYHNSVGKNWRYSLATKDHNHFSFYNPHLSILNHPCSFSLIVIIVLDIETSHVYNGWLWFTLMVIIKKKKKKRVSIRLNMLNYNVNINTEKLFVFFTHRAWN